MSDKGTLVGNLSIPALLLHERREESVEVLFSAGEKKLQISPELLLLRDEVVRALRKQNHVIHNGPTFSWADVELKRNADLLTIEVELGKSEYFNNLLHLALDDSIRNSNEDLSQKVEKIVNPDQILNPSSIGGHPLSSGVGVTTIIRLSDGNTVLTRRSNSVAVQPGRVHVATSEAFSLRDLKKHRKLELKEVIIRGLHEELLREGERIKEVDINVHVFGLCVDLRHMWPGFIVEVSIPLTWTQIEAGQGFAPDKWERDKIWPVKLNPEECAKELKNIHEWTGFGALALVSSLIREYGDDEVRKAFQRLSNI